MVSLLKTNLDSKVEEAIVDDAIVNVRSSVAVLQSLNVIKSIITIHDKPNEHLLQKVVTDNVATHAFDSFKKLKLDIRASSKGSQLITEALANQAMADKSYNFEAQVQNRLAFVDFVLRYTDKAGTGAQAVIDSIWTEMVDGLLVESEAMYFKKWIVQLCDAEDGTVVYLAYLDK